VRYAFVAACADCRTVQLGLIDGSGQTLGVTPEKTETVILAGVAPATAEYYIHLSAPGCEAQSCHIGFRVMKLASSPPAVATATDASPPVAAAAHVVPVPVAPNAVAAVTPPPKKNVAPLKAPLKTASLPDPATSAKAPTPSSSSATAPSCSTLQTCGSGRSFCIHSCRQNNAAPGCAVECQQSFQLCSRTGDWSTRACQRTGLVKN
jgi:hypothetical protein